MKNSIRVSAAAVTFANSTAASSVPASVPGATRTTCPPTCSGPRARQLQQQRHLAAELEAVADLHEAGIPAQVLQDRGVDLAAGGELHGHSHQEAGLAAAVGGRRLCHSTFTTMRVTSSAGTSPPR